MKYFLIAGEASGDLLGASLMKGILAKDPQAEFNYWGGDEMEKVAPGLCMHYKNNSIMGFVEVLLNIRTIKQNMNLCKSQILAYHPDVLVLIDYPGFNMRMAAHGKLHGIKTCYFIAPKIWAWNEKRGKKLEQYVDLLLLIFPFESSYFKKWKVHAVYTGNPLFEQLRSFQADENFLQKNQFDNKPIIALLPGSRKQEIKRMLPNMVRLAERYPQYRFLVAGSPGLEAEFYAPFLNPHVQLLFNCTRDLLAHAEAAVVCSGTASLETGFMGVPHVVGYVAQRLTYIIGRMVVKVKYASLVNLNLGREAVKELIQDDYNMEVLQQEFEAILKGGAKRPQILKDYEELFALFQTGKAAENAAVEIKKLISA